MAAASAPAAVVVNAPITEPSGAMPFDFTKPPAIEGFTPVSRRNDENFKEKLLRKTQENPFVPIGELQVTTRAQSRLQLMQVEYNIQYIQNSIFW